MGAHHTLYQGCPLVLADPAASGSLPDLVAFYRWHVPDPVVFQRRLRVVIQQIGAVMIRRGQDDLRADVEATGTVAGRGWRHVDGPVVEWFAICERVDDYCAAAFAYCRDRQPVPRVDVAAATADVERRPFEQPSPLEAALGG
jgi:hypothetical protein